MADRHLPAGLPQIELQQLAAAIDRALKRPRPRAIERPQLGHIVIDQRLAPVEANSASSSNTRIVGSLGSSRNNRWISALNGSSLDTPARRR
jgi:ABC-type transporter Mla subunit MlaD